MDSVVFAISMVLFRSGCSYVPSVGFPSFIFAGFNRVEITFQSCIMDCHIRSRACFIHLAL